MNRWEWSQEENTIEVIDLHLRNTARSLVKLETVEEALQFLLESFWFEFGCDYVSIVQKVEDVLSNKTSRGEAQSYEKKLPFSCSSCVECCLSKPQCSMDGIEEWKHCNFLREFENEGFVTWFTFPIKESDSRNFDVCVVGYRKEVPLNVKAYKSFREFGKDFAILIETVQNKETEKQKLKAELEDKDRLKKRIVHFKELVTQTLVGDDYFEITKTLSHLIGRTVILFDRFLHPISSFYIGESNEELEKIVSQLDTNRWNLVNTPDRELWLQDGEDNHFGIWKVICGNELFGYLGVIANPSDFDLEMRMTLNYALDVYAIQFKKQKLVVDAKEQAKDGFIHQLFQEKIENKENMIGYANLFNLNLFQPNRIGVFAIECKQSEQDSQSTKFRMGWIWEQIRTKLQLFNRNIIVTQKEGRYVLIVPDQKEHESNLYWTQIYNQIRDAVSQTLPGIDVFLGISSSTKSMEDFHVGYRQALQALKILRNRFSNKKIQNFDNLGAFSVLFDLKESFATNLFIKKYLDPLLNYGNEKGKDLFDTLRVYLTMNGNLKETAEYLFIHRSSLKYRLEKITDLLQIELDDPEERFNLMLAFKLYDLFEQKNVDHE
ncbi:PucR family transcriptional regulator [Brevibacillus ginsengisoli]|uniref:PucR family transcriptional regulator n=1 Tax=Brevibacillus ginsengisoli TaxID=363854 RepID=UPI003CF2D3E6